MHTDYDRISIEYQLSKLQPWRKYLEAHTFLSYREIYLTLTS